VVAEARVGLVVAVLEVLVQAVQVVTEQRLQFQDHL
jgi:hypothetical protein